MAKINLLINLPPGFHQHPALGGIYARLAERAYLRQTSHDTPEQILDDLKWADAVLMWSWPVLTHELLDQCPKLQFAAQLDISQHGARVALDRHFPISCARRAFSPAVAEMALGLIMSTLRKISTFHAQMREGSETWPKVFPTDIDIQERQLTGRPVGIIGFGAVGQRLGELLAPFQAPLRIFDPYLPQAVADRHHAQLTDLHSVITESDVVVISAASNEGSRHLIGQEEIALFRQDAVLVNVARAALVDTDALIARLTRNDMFAAIDVFDQEPLPANSPLRQLPNAFLTPHRAGGVMESVLRILTQLTDDLEAFFDGKERKYPVTEHMLPALDA